MPTHASQALATAKNCMACHGVANKLVGPSLRDVASRYQDRADAAALLAGKIAKGSAGAWGSMPMPAQPQVSAAEATTLAEWILGLR
ncbi:Cytochrome c-552 precursor [compost metagenome]